MIREQQYMDQKILQGGSMEWVQVINIPAGRVNGMGAGDQYTCMEGRWEGAGDYYTCREGQWDRCSGSIYLQGGLT